MDESTSRPELREALENARAAMKSLPPASRVVMLGALLAEACYAAADSKEIAEADMFAGAAVRMVYERIAKLAAEKKEA